MFYDLKFLNQQSLTYAATERELLPPSLPSTYVCMYEYVRDAGPECDKQQASLLLSQKILIGLLLLYCRIKRIKRTAGQIMAASADQKGKR